MIGHSLRSLLLAAAVLGLLAFLYGRSQMVSVAEHDQYILTLRSLQALEVSFNESILKARHAYLTNYDPLVEHLQQLNKVSQQLAQLPTFVDGPTASELRTLQEEYLALLVEQESLSERFKGENAILHNSLSFFPIAASELAQKAAQTDLQAAGKIRELLRNILTYNLYSYQETLAAINRQIAELRGKQQQYSNLVNPLQLERAIRHAETILKYKRELDSLTLKLLNLPTQKTLQQIQQRYSAAYSASLATTNSYRLALYLLSIGLLTAIAYSVLRLRNTSLALNHANATLEQKVEDRTEKLHQANTALIEKKDKLAKYVEELHEAHKELQRVAVTDDLTGLYTRRFLFEWMEKQLASFTRSPGHFSCLLLDIDFFKSINDTFGHGTGDQVLKTVAEVIRNAVRNADIVGRYGGEEFLVLLPNTDLGQAAVVAEKVRQAIEINIRQPRPVTTSIGIGSCGCDHPSREQHNITELISSLLEVTDQALYRAKEGGRNRALSAKKPIRLDQVQLVPPAASAER